MTKQNPVAESFSKEVGPTIKDKKGDKNKSHLIPLRLTLKISFVFGPTPLFALHAYINDYVKSAVNSRIYFGPLQTAS